MLAHTQKVFRLSRRKQATKERMVTLMAHRRMIVALATVHGWDSRYEQALRTASAHIHNQIVRLRGVS